MWGHGSQDAPLQCCTPACTLLQGALSSVHVSDQHRDPCEEHFAAGLPCSGSVSWNQPNSSQAENQPLQPLPGKGLSSPDTHRILRCYQLSNFGVIYQLLRVCTFQKPPELWSQPPAAGEVWEVGRGRKRPHHPPGGHTGLSAAGPSQVRTSYVHQNKTQRSQHVTGDNLRGLPMHKSGTV